MQYMLLVYGSGDAWEALSDEERESQMREYMTLGERYPQIRGGDELDSSTTATTVRVHDGRPLTSDGPFAETKEQLGGYYMVECDNLDEAIEIASKIPAARTGGAVEVRPVVQR